jgi:hypothetical protein
MILFLRLRLEVELHFPTVALAVISQPSLWYLIRMDSPSQDGNVLTHFFKYYGPEESDQASEEEFGVDYATQSPLAGQSCNRVLFQSSFPLEKTENPSKKRKQTFVEQRKELLNYAAISEALRSMQQAAHWCCRLMCFSWLATNVVLFCREKYLLIETSKGRKQWLEDRLLEMERFDNQRLIYSYCVEGPGGEKSPCCHSAWDFTFGVSRRTRERASLSRRNKKRCFQLPKKISAA